MLFNIERKRREIFPNYLLILLFFPLALIAFEPYPVTPYPVLGFKEVPFFDHFQQINRQLLVWYPVDPQVVGAPSAYPWDTFHVAMNATPAKTPTKRPLIVLSHGYMGNPHHLSWLIREFVHQGFMVIGIRHTDLIDGKIHANHWQRARDIKIILDQFFSNSLSDFVDENQIGIAGYSLGGTTSIWVAGGRTTKLDNLMPGPEYAALREFMRANEVLSTLNKDMMGKNWRDPRIKAAFVMAPAWSWLFDETSLTTISIPVYLIAAEADRVLVTKNNAGFFARHIPHALYQTIPGKADHYIFISALNERQRKLVDPTAQFDFLLEDDASIDRTWIQLQVAEEATRFFQSVFNTPH